MELFRRATYLVAYDIRNPKRLSRTARILLGFGDRVQLSVFRCHLTRREHAMLRRRLAAAIDHLQDQVIFAVLGGSDGRGESALETLGRALDNPTHTTVII